MKDVALDITKLLSTHGDVVVADGFDRFRDGGNLGKDVAGVYVLHILQLGVYYIGSSLNIRRRFATHWSDLVKNKHKNYKLQDLHNAGYQIDLFSFIPINPTKEKHTEEDMRASVLALEQSLLYASDCNILNLYTSAYGPRGCTRSAVTRKRISVAGLGNTNALGYKHTDIARERITAAGLGRVISDDTKKLLSVAQGMPVSVNGVKYTSSRQAGKVLSCGRTTVLRRCKSDKAEWSSWFFT